jgi:signal transduction histidine kinase
MSLPLAGGDWLNAIAQPPAPSWLWLRAAVLGAGITAVLLIVAVLLAVHYLLAPVQRLRLAARDFSRGQLRLLPEKGPEDIRDVIRAFNEMQTTVGKAQEEKARMLAALAHDLRTPLTAMRLRVELLPPGEDRERLLRNLAEMQSLAESTLEFIRGTAAEPPRRFDVGALLESLCEDLADMGLAVHCEELPRSVLEGHPEALRRAVRNLIENAVSYGGEARVSLTRTASSVVIHVTDPGPGIAPELRERVFEPFFRVDTSRSRNSGGAGLGLAIARSLVSAMGGQVLITDGPGGKGCEVRISLPEPSAG